MRILRAIKTKGGGGGYNNTEPDGEVHCEEGVYRLKVWNYVFVTLQLVIRWFMLSFSSAKDLPRCLLTN